MKKTHTPAAELRAWRKRQPTANPRADHLTQAEAELWYGLWNGGRTWKRWEAGDHPVPEPLLKRIRAGVKVDTDEAEGYAAEVFERTLSPVQKNVITQLLQARRNGWKPYRDTDGNWYVPISRGTTEAIALHGSPMRAFVDRGLMVEIKAASGIRLYDFTPSGLALAERSTKRRRPTRSRR